MDKMDVFGQLITLSGKSVSLNDITIKLTFTSPNKKAQTFEAKTDAEGNYRITFSPNEVGKWSVKAQFDGNAQLKDSSREASFNVTKRRAEIVFETGTTGALGTEIVVVGRMEPQLKGELINLKIKDPSDKTTIMPGVTTEASGVFRYTLKLDTAGDWEVTATWTGNAQYEAVSQTLSISVSNELGKVILVLGGSYQENDQDWITSKRMMDYVHNILVKHRGLDDERDIYFLSPDPKTSGADNVTSAAALELAITKWAAKQVNSKVPLFIYMLSHNIGNQFLLDRHGNEDTYLTPAQLASWLDVVPKGTPVTIIIEACHSGNFIRTLNGQPTALVAPTRTIIASARGDKQSAIYPGNLYSFSRSFFDRISANKTIAESFHDAEDFMVRIPILNDQHPEIDANGDGKVNESQDYAAVSKVYIPLDFVSKALPPNIFDATPSQTLNKGVSSLPIFAKILGANITQVTATIIPPGIDTGEDLISWSSLKFPELSLVKVIGKENEYSATYGNFTKPGDYTVIINAENADGSAAPIETTITVPGTAVLLGDVNGDGKIQSADAILLLRILTNLQSPTEAQKQAGDMNGDGVLGANDVILILRKVAGLLAPGKDTDVSSVGTVTVSFGKPKEQNSYMAIPLEFDGSKVLSGGEITVAFDGSNLCFESVSSENGVLMAYNLTKAGMIKIAFAGADSLRGKSIAEIRFMKSGDGRQKLDFRTVELYNREARPLKVIVNGFSPVDPERDLLLQNYPNPFNPETWIPYQLSKDTNVEVRIYDSSSRLVRILVLGSKSAGFYTSKDRAAYWDGKNEAGEKISSGVYFYSIQAGSYSASRKMIVVH